LQGTAAADQIGPRQWQQRLAPYRQPLERRALAELAVTALPFAALWFAMWASLGVGYWLTLLLAVPTAGFLVRLFMIQHDCGHGSFFRDRRRNDALGRVIAVLTLTPYAHWRLEHARHHATAGNLDRRGHGDVDLLTVAEYRALPRWRRLGYRLSRDPLVMLGLGPLYVFVLKHRVPAHPLRADLAAWRDVMASNLVLAMTLGAGIWLLGARDLVLVQLPVTWLASAMGIWLFYVQHQFERTSWERDPAWCALEGGLHGSTHLDLPPLLRWFTANIGVHHIHHLCSRIPSYRLGEVLRAHPELREVNRVTLGRSARSFGLGLWDEAKRRLVSFAEATDGWPARAS
jgi:omega-6 fatty acid desaturase (delta-12 desaturase)